MPSLTSIEHRQATTVDQLLLSDQRLGDLVVEVKSLGNKEKEREKKEVDREERDQNTVKALLLLAEKTEGVKKSLANIEAFIGVDKIESGSLSMLDRLGKIEMSVEEWLERLRDPKADGRFLYALKSAKLTHNFLGMDVDKNDSMLPTPSAAASSTPIVRHEMAVSPIPKMYTSVQGKRDLSILLQSYSEIVLS